VELGCREDGRVGLLSMAITGIYHVHVDRARTGRKNWGG
jgi:hypothetical protein